MRQLFCHMEFSVKLTIVFINKQVTPLALTVCVCSTVKLAEPDVIALGGLTTVTNYHMVSEQTC